MLTRSGSSLDKADAMTSSSPITDADIEALATQFAAAAIPATAWTHHAHLTVATWHVARYGSDAALDRLRAGIRRLNAAHGTIDSDTRGYHETITCAFVRLLAAFLAARPPGEPLAATLAALLADPLAARDVLLRHYSRERLLSVAARRGWIEPDLAPLP
jgi:hypothetical protein